MARSLESMMPGMSDRASDTDGYRWQYMGRKFWKSLDDKASRKLVLAKYTGVQNCSMWDGGTLVEIDLQNMMRLPGRQPVRYAPELDESSPMKAPSSMSSPVMGKHARRSNSSSPRRRGSRNSPPRRRSPTNRGMKTQGSRSNSPVRAKDVQQQEGLRAFVHSAFLTLEKPRFSFRGISSQEEEFQEFEWQRKLELCEDSTDKVVCVARIYASLFENFSSPELPVKGTPAQTMAALALALHIAGASRCQQGGRWWYPSARGAHGLQQRSAAAPKSPTPAPRSPSQPRQGEAKDAQKSFASSSSAGSFLNLSRTKSLPTLTRSSTPSSGTAGFAPLQMKALASPSKPRAQPPPGAVDCFTFRLDDAPSSRAQSLKLTEAWREWRGLAQDRAALAMPHLPKAKGDYQWIDANDPESRLRRLGGLCSTLWQASAERESLRSLGRVYMLSADRDKIRGPPAPPPRPEVRVEPGLTALELALLQVEHGRRAGAVIICADDDVGGSWFSETCSGSLHGPEEAACLRSDLYPRLREAAIFAEQQGMLTSGPTPYIPEVGTTVCTDLRIYRDGRADGFVPYTVPVTIPAALCITLKNLNPHQDPNAEKRVEMKRFNQEQYVQQIRHKFNMVLLAAQQLELEVITVSDMACKRLHNDGRLLGECLGRSLQEAKFEPPSVVLSGSSKFIAAVRQGIINRGSRA